MTIPPLPRTTSTGRRKRVAGMTLLAAGFVAALMPVFHWFLGSALAAMSYLLGTATLITIGTVAVYLAERPAHTRVELKEAGE